jgi:hypothetical protein
LLQRIRGIDRLSSRGKGLSKKSIILLQMTRGIDRLSSRGKGLSNKSIILLQRTRGNDRHSSRAGAVLQGLLSIVMNAFLGNPDA